MKSGDPILDALDQIPGLRAGTEAPSEPRLAAIRAATIRTLRPVRPLPSSRTLVLLAFAAFVLFSIVATIPNGFFGFHHLSLSQKLIYYGLILLSAAVLSAVLVDELIPGSRRRLGPVVALVLPPVLVSLSALGLFPELDFTHFVQRGVPCLELGTLCAALSGLLAYLLMRRGFVTSPVRAALTAALLCGLSGFAVLALHCPVLNIAHIFVWHFGAVLIAVAAGTVVGFVRPTGR